jgi:hypothetical protein
MTNATHTPGPWAVSKPSGNYIDAPAVRGSIAALTFSATPADARLIAAAPDLLTALEDLVKSNFGQPRSVTVPALDNARAAIAKATGATDQ